MISVQMFGGILRMFPAGIYHLWLISTELSKTEVKIIQEDSRKKLIEENSIDFILIFPPYGDSRT